MPNEISLPAVTAASASGNAPGEPRAVTGELAQSSAAAPKPSPIIINPTLRLDAALGLVVIEFRNDSGAITTSIPSQRQLAEYQRWETTRFGPAPEGRSTEQADASGPSRDEQADLSGKSPHR
jgi:hypothetical protein